MTLPEIANFRLSNQLIANSDAKSTGEVVSRMGAMQAQDLLMAKWAVGVRFPGSTEKEIDEALDKGEILRTHLLRPTWHFVSRNDIRWILELTAPHIKAGLESRHRGLELNERIIAKSNSILREDLQGGNHLTREEIVARFAGEGIKNDDNRAAHLLMLAELDGIICNGVKRKNKITYALLSERVPETLKLSREDSLKELARKYFQSHGPATIQDFTWWSGLPARDARNALEMVKPELNSDTINALTYWFKDVIRGKSGLYLLPAFDEFIISYRDRTATLAEIHNRRTISMNGIFKPVMVYKGQVIGLWKRKSEKEKILIEAEIFSKLETIKKAINRRSNTYGAFSGREVIVKYENTDKTF